MLGNFQIGGSSLYILQDGTITGQCAFLRRIYLSLCPSSAHKVWRNLRKAVSHLYAVQYAKSYSVIMTSRGVDVSKHPFQTNR
jgi:hypothetical protein